MKCFQFTTPILFLVIFANSLHSQENSTIVHSNNKDSIIYSPPSGGTDQGITGNSQIQHVPNIGMSGGPFNTAVAYLKKGEAMNFGSYYTVNINDLCPDSIPVSFQQAIAGTSVTNGIWFFSTPHNEKRWLSISNPPRPFFLDYYEYPTQWNNRIISLHLDTKNLNVGDTMPFHYAVTSESTIGPIAIQEGVLTWTEYLYVIPYPINLYLAQAMNGSMGIIDLKWNKPLVQFWDLHHYAIFRNDTDSVRINNLNISLKLRDSIPLNDTSVISLHGTRGIASFYAITGYDSAGKVIALSNSLRPLIQNSSFSLQSPHDGQVLLNLTPTFYWDDVPGATFELWISDNPSFSGSSKYIGISLHQFTLPAPLADHHSWFWKVMTSDSLFSNETSWEFKTNMINFLPSPFLLMSPPNNALLTHNPVNFSWRTSTDEGDSLRYLLLISKHISFIDTLIKVVLPDTFYLPFSILPEDSTLFWKVLAIDSRNDSTSCSFIYHLLIQRDEPPGGFTLLEPIFCSGTVPTQTDLHPTFKWSKSKNTDPGDTIKYTLFYSPDPNFINANIISNLTDTIYQPTSPLIEDSYYYYKVKATDLNGHETWNYGLPNCFATNSVDMPPQPFNFLRPLPDQNIPPGSYTFSWQNPVDDLYDAHLFIFYISTDSLFYNQDTAYVDQNMQWSTGITPGDYYAKVKCKSKPLPLNQGLGCFENAAVSFANRIIHVSDTSIMDIHFIDPLIGYGNADTLEISLLYNLYWNSENVNKVRIEFSFDNGLTYSIFKDSVQVLSSNMTFPVRIPDTVTSAFRIRITDISNSRAYDINPYPLNIKAPLKQLTIIHPNGNDSLKVTSPYTINWTKQKVDTVSLYYSTNNGNEWIPIIEKKGGYSYNWTIPNTPSDSCLIKIKDYFYPTVKDVSDNRFVIFPVRIIHVSKNGSDSTGNGSTESPYSSIQKAINVNTDYDSIKVAAGTYYESIIIPSPFVATYILRGGFNPSTWEENSELYSTIINPQGNEGIMMPIYFQTSYFNFDISGFTFKNASYGVHAQGGNNYSKQILFSKCRFVNCDAAIYFWHPGIIMDRCIITDCIDGLKFPATDFNQSIISNCIFRNIQNAAINISYAYTTMNLYNNTFYNAHNFIYCYNSYGSVINIENNLFYSCNGAIELIGNVNPFVYHNLFFHTLKDLHLNGQTLQVDSTNLHTNPLIADSISPDFHLQDLSPCIGAGKMNALITDLEGNPRPSPTGSNPDIGAYENPLPGPLVPMKKIWTGLVSINWHDPDNWNPSGVPSHYDTIEVHANVTSQPVVKMPNLACYDLMIFKDASVTIDSLIILSVNGHLALDGPVPFVFTFDPSNIECYSAHVGGKVLTDYTDPILSKGVCWSTQDNPDIYGDHSTNGPGTGYFSSELSGLSSQKTYYIRCYAINSLGISYGEEKKFTTNGGSGSPPCACPGIPTIIDTRDSSVYPTIQIGTQCWLRKNLNIGTMINNTKTQNPGNDTIEKYCWGNDESYCTIYGGLYQWDEMMQGSTTQGIQGICLIGWHIPTYEEWNTLWEYLGGYMTSGGKMKEIGTDHWQSPNTGATNSSGFTGIPAGSYYNNFFDFHLSGYFWASTKYSLYDAWYMKLSYNNIVLEPDAWGFQGSCSVRCIKD